MYYMEKTVQAIILAGGKGTRLSPLTENLPKPLIKILDKTALDTVLDNLSKTSVTNTTVTAMYLTDMIKKHCSAKNIKVISEKEPLGTAGAVKNAYDGKSDYILVLSGDGVYDFDLQKIIDFHTDKSCDVTIVTHFTENPSEYGMVVSDNDGKITHFVEKPSWKHVTTNRVNTGIYMLSKNILEKIHDRVNFDFSKDLFPLLLQENASLYSLYLGGYWCDIGTLGAYFQCNADCLDSKVAGINNTGLTYSELQKLGVDVEMPVYVSQKAKIGKNVKLGKYSVISDYVQISDGCDLSHCIISEKTFVGKNSCIFGSLIGKNCVIEENCLISQGTAMGDNCFIGQSSIIKKYSKISSGQKIVREKNMNINFSDKKQSIFGDNGIICSDLNYCGNFSELGYAISKALISSKPDNYCVRLGLMCDYSDNASIVKQAIMSGVRFSGIRSYNFGKGFESLCHFAAKSFLCDVTLFIYSTNKTVSIKMFDSNAMSVSDEFEHSVEKEFSNHESFKNAEAIFPTQNIAGIEEFYYASLIKSVLPFTQNSFLDDFVCNINCENNFKENYPAKLLIRALCENGAKVNTNKKAPFTIFISPDGTNCYISSSYARADFEHISAILIKHAANEGLEISLPKDCPQVFKTLTYGHGHTVCDRENFNSSSEPWLTDPLFAILRLCFILNQNSNTFEELLSQIPEFETYVDTYLGSKNRAAVMQKLSKLNTGNSDCNEGIRLSLADGVVTIIPTRSSGFRIISEAKNFEAAKELCSKIEDIIEKEK